MEESIKIGNWTINYNPKPIPDRRFDYDVVHDDYDGERGSYYLFYTETIEEAKLEIQNRELVIEKDKQIQAGTRKKKGD